MAWRAARRTHSKRSEGSHGGEEYRERSNLQRTHQPENDLCVGVLFDTRVCVRVCCFLYGDALFLSGHYAYGQVPVLSWKVTVGNFVGFAPCCVHLFLFSFKGAVVAIICVLLGSP